MEKQKRWQFYLILAVLILTLYNILPTLFYYSKPLGSPIDEPRTKQVAETALSRIDQLGADSIEWLYSFSKLLGLKPASIALHKEDPGIIEVAFHDSKDAELFRRFLPRAGGLIPFAPAQLDLYESVDTGLPTVLVSRQIKVALNPEDKNALFQYTPKRDASGAISPLYRQLVDDRVLQLMLAFGGPGRASQQVSAIIANPDDPSYDEMALALAKEIVEVDRIVAKNNSAIAKRYFASLFENSEESSESLMQKFSSKLEKLKARLASERTVLIDEQEKAKIAGTSPSTVQAQQLALLENQKNSAEAAAALLNRNKDLFKSAAKPLTRQQALQAIQNSPLKEQQQQVIPLEGHNPFIEALVVDWENDKIQLRFYPDVQAVRSGAENNEAAAYRKEKLNKYIINEIARASRLADETFLPDEESFSVALNDLINSHSFLVMNLGYVAEKQATQLQEQLNASWTPENVDLAHSAYPILDYDSYLKLKPEERKLGLLVYAPSASHAEMPEGFRSGSIYVIAKNLELISQKYRQTPDAVESKQFQQDFEKLKTVLQQNGFIGYPGSSYGMAQRI